MKKRILALGFTVATIFTISGCGGGGDSVVKDASYYKKAYKDYTSIKSLHTKKTTLFTLDEVKKSLDDLNITTQADEAYKLQFIERFKNRLEGKLANGDGYNMDNKTAILIPNDENSTTVINGNKSMDLLGELTDTFRQVGPPPCCEDGIPDFIIVRFIAHLDDNSGVDENNDSQPFVAVLPEAPKEIQGLKKKVELDDYFYGGSLVSVPKLRDDFGKVVDKGLGKK